MQDYRGRLPAAESWESFRKEEEAAEKEGGQGSSDDQFAWLAETTAALRRVDPDGVRSGETYILLDYLEYHACNYPANVWLLVRAVGDVHREERQRMDADKCWFR